MGCPKRVRKENTFGCEYFGGKEDGYCDHEHTEFYHCVDWMASGKYPLSHSQSTSWERCPRQWYINYILGVKKRSELQTTQLRQGSYFGNLLSGEEGDVEKLKGKTKKEIEEIEVTPWADHEWIFKASVEFMVEFIKENEMMPFDNLKWEVWKRMPGFRGKIDCELIDKPSVFGEMKYTGNVDWYLNNLMGTGQLEKYFLLDEKYKDAWMLPVKNPVVKYVKPRKKDSCPENKLEEVKKDVHKRPGFYFPGYKEDKKPFKWGRKFSYLEFGVADLQRKIDWVRREIMIACSEMYFVQRKANCLSPFPCDYVPICEAGGSINLELFMRKGEKFNKKPLDLSELHPDNDDDRGIVHD